MVDTYTIYLINNSAAEQTFWCFLAPPQQLVGDPAVFANSSACLAIASNSPDSNSFAIPVQYVVGAGATNEAVGLNVQVTSGISQDCDINDAFQATYANAPPPLGPALASSGTSTSPGTISIATNAFDQSTNENEYKWFANQSFGIQTESGFMGMSWSPSPSQTRTLTPTLTFYISVGTFGINSLAEWTQISNSSQTVSVPGNFQYNESTVTYNQDGSWSIQQGPPPSSLYSRDLRSLVSRKHLELTAIALLSTNGNQTDTVSSVRWDKKTAVAGLERDAQVSLTGEITVSTALIAAFTYFVLSGVSFTVKQPKVGSKTLSFTYSGSQSSASIEALLKAGASIIFGGAP